MKTLYRNFGMKEIIEKAETLVKSNNNLIISILIIALSVSLISNFFLASKAIAIHKSYVDLENSCDELNKTAELYREKINKTLSWFSLNYEFNESSKTQRNISRIIDKACISKSDLKCIIYTDCISSINSEILNFTYERDPLKGNNFQSIEYFLERKKGDCEDFSVFYRAELVKALEICDEAPELKIILKNSEETLDKGGVFPVVICRKKGPIPDEGVGHCTVAISKKEIKSEKDLKELSGAPIIESINGDYLGDVNAKSSNVYLPPEDDEYNESRLYVYQVITEDDTFVKCWGDYSERYGDWLSYSEFLFKF